MLNKIIKIVRDPRQIMQFLFFPKGFKVLPQIPDQDVVSPAYLLLVQQKIRADITTLPDPRFRGFTIKLVLMTLLFPFRFFRFLVATEIIRSYINEYELRAQIGLRS